MQISLKSLKDQIIVITGASSGIGLVTARMAAQRGAKVVLVARNEDALRQLTEEMRSQGRQAIYVVADVGNEADVNRIVDCAIAAFGGFDTWVNNAGISIFGRCLDVSIPDMRRMFETDFWGVVYGSRAAVNYYRQRGGCGALINIGSFLGDRAVVVQSTYSAAKHAVHGWTDALRMELEKDKIPVSVTLIHPGRIDTPYNEHAVNYMPHEPAHRGMIYPPEAVAEAILYSAAHPKRDMYVGFQAKALAILGGISPRLTDKLMEVWAFPSQQSDRPANPPETNALYEPGYGLHERGTNQGWMRSGSLYVEASKRPLLSTAALVGTGLTLWSLAKPMLQDSRTQNSRTQNSKIQDSKTQNFKTQNSKPVPQNEYAHSYQ